MQIRRRQLGEEPPVHNRSVVKISYIIKMTTQKIRSHDDRRSATWICFSSPTMIYSIVQNHKKPSQCSRLQYKHYIIHDEVQKGESDSPIHISTDEQIGIHFGKASIQDETTCILKLELVEMNLLSWKGRLSKLKEGTQTFIFVIEITLQLGGRIYLCKSPDWTNAFLFGKWIKISDRQWLPIVVNMGGRLIADVS
jgi:hypothetical protein